MKIAYLSDLHLEINGLNAFMEKGKAKYPTADVLVVAGDTIAVEYCEENKTDAIAKSIQKGVEAFKKKIKKYKKVLMVMGNHEHYHHQFSNTYDSLKKIFSDCPNVQVLENEAVVIDDVLFFGASFWTNFENENPVSMDAAARCMNDYRIIYKNKLMRTPISPSDTLNEHINTMRILKTTLEHNKNEKVVIIGHHAPSTLSLNKKHSGNMLDGAYYTDLGEFIQGHPQIKLWFHGHCHMNTDYMIGETRVLSNQCGYYMEPQFQDFTPNKTVEI